MCHQTVGLVSRHIEAAGIPTLSLTSARDITTGANPPRAAFLDYPLGHTSGRAHDQAGNAAVMRAALDVFATAHADDMYAAIDALTNKLDRQILKHKEKTVDRKHGH